MKLVFCIAGTINYGGMERVLSQRVNYFVEKFGYDITIITTENDSKVYKNKSPFFYFSPKIKIIDIGIKYADFFEQNNGEGIYNFIKRQIKLKKIRKKHLLLLNENLKNIKPDILVCMGQHDRVIGSKVSFPCKKILENHFNKQFFTQELENKNFFGRIKSLGKTYMEYSNIKKYDEFLVLTDEDKKAWGNEKIKVISNPLSFVSEKVSNCKNKKIISVGRLSNEKGFDILIEVWKKVREKHKDWILEIYGEGYLRKELQDKIDSLNLRNTLILKGNEKDIKAKYLENSVYVMSSRFEGFGMTLIEAMSCGLPLVSFDCPYGPRKIIKNGENGFLVKFGNINEMAEKINYLIENEDKRIEMGKKSKELSYDYSEEKIMNQWKELFENLVKR